MPMRLTHALAPWSGLALALGLALLPASSAQGAGVITVCPSGCDHTGVGPAVAAAASGDVIEVAAGTYPAGVIIEKSLTLRGQGESTVLNGQGRTSVILVRGKVTVILEKLKLTGGIGIKVDLNIRLGGGVYSGAEAVTRIKDCVITGNEAWEGGGVYHNDGTMEITGSVISGNTAYEAGGGVHVNTDGRFTMTDTQVVENTTVHPPDGDFAQANGGGLHVRGRAEVFGGAISRNRTGDRGGGIYNFSQGRLTLTDVEVRGNEAGIDGEGEGGGIWSSATLTLNRALVADNIGEGDGGGLLNLGVGTVTGSTFSGNSAANGGGLAVQVGFSAQQVGQITVSTSTFNDNVAAGDGGGITIGDRATATITLCTVSGNSAASGAGIAEVGAVRTEVAHCTVYGNKGGSGSQLASITRRRLRVGYSLIGKTPDIGSACAGELASLGYNLEPDGSCGFDGNGDMVRADAGVLPLADNGGPTWTHALAAGSEAIDRGHPNRCLAADQRGAPRPVDGDGDGTALCDIGAFEYGSSVDTSTATLTPPPPTATQTMELPTLTPTATFVVRDTPTPSTTPTFVIGPETATPTPIASRGPVVGTVYMPVAVARAPIEGANQ